MVEQTREELNAIHSLKRLAKRWPRSLWLFAAGGQLHIMRADENQNHVHVGEGIDPNYMVTSVEIPSDGGDW